MVEVTAVVDVAGWVGVDVVAAVVVGWVVAAVDDVDAAVVVVGWVAVAAGEVGVAGIGAAAGVADMQFDEVERPPTGEVAEEEKIAIVGIGTMVEA